MIHKGVEYSVSESADPDFWNWQFAIAGKTHCGKTRTKLRNMAIRRVELRINAALKKLQKIPDQPTT